MGSFLWYVGDQITQGDIDIIDVVALVETERRRDVAPPWCRSRVPGRGTVHFSFI
jgi:hypothetical protein